MTIPDYIGEIEGYRAFQPHPNARLASTGVEWLWTPGPQEAMCLSNSISVRKVHRNLVNPETGEKQLHLVEICTHGLIPSPECNCGIWILKSPDDLIQRFGFQRLIGDWSQSTYSRLSWYVDSPSTYIVAKVKGWGRCIEGSDGHSVVGWRCEYAEITALVTASPPMGGVASREDAEPYAKHYGVDIVEDEAFMGHGKDVDPPPEPGNEWDELIQAKANAAQAKANSYGHLHLKAMKKLAAAKKQKGLY